MARVLVQGLGGVLPDLLALFLLLFDFRLTPVVRHLVGQQLRVVSQISPEERWTAENEIGHELEMQVFRHTFFIPGSIAVVGFVSSVLENGHYFEIGAWLFVLGLLTLNGIDIWYCLGARETLKRPEKVHRRLIIALVSLAVIGKIVLHLLS